MPPPESDIVIKSCDHSNANTHNIFDFSFPATQNATHEVALSYMPFLGA
jgi:hypothetical protein